MIKHIRGSVFDTYARIIAHQVNCMGVMGSGVAAQVKERYPDAYQQYRQLCELNRDDRISLLGMVQMVPVSKENYNGYQRIFVANMFGQYNYGRNNGVVYTDYQALDQCLHRLADYAKCVNGAIALPYRIGCGRGNGDWEGRVLPMIKNTLGDHDVLLCEYPSKF